MWYPIHLQKWAYQAYKTQPMSQKNHHSRRRDNNQETLPDFCRKYKQQTYRKQATGNGILSRKRKYSSGFQLFSCYYRREFSRLNQSCGGATASLITKTTIVNKWFTYGPKSFCSTQYLIWRKSFLNNTYLARVIIGKVNNKGMFFWKYQILRSIWYDDRLILWLILSAFFTGYLELSRRLDKNRFFGD